MTGTVWLLLFAFAAVIAWFAWDSKRKWAARRRAEEERFASFMAATAGAAPPKAVVPPPAKLPVTPATAPSPAAVDEPASQKLLFDAAHKAGDAGEPALAIQLYARLLARYPATKLAAQAREAVEAQKKKLFKA